MYYIAGRANFSPVAVTLAQQPRLAVAAPIEAAAAFRLRLNEGEGNGDQRKVGQVGPQFTHVEVAWNGDADMTA
jgi:hypothetical protein